MISRFVAIIAAAVSLMLFGPAVLGQQTVQGVPVKVLIIDPSGAPTPEACVKIASKSQDFQLVLSANKSGWLEAALPPGRYQVAAAAQGFNNVIKDVDVGEEKNEPIRMKLALGVCSPCLEVRGPPLTVLEVGSDGLPQAAAPKAPRKSCTGCACFFDNR